MVKFGIGLLAISALGFAIFRQKGTDGGRGHVRSDEEIKTGEEGARKREVDAVCCIILK